MSQLDSTVKQSHRVAELDGVRACAVLLVLLGHLVAPDEKTMAIVAPYIPSLLMMVVSHGWMGVDLFFSLSGFLITGILLDNREGPGYFRNFYVRRVFRIFPLYLATVAIYWACYGKSGYFVLSLLFLSNMAGLLKVPSPHGPGVYWSLAVEEHFYIVWPLIVRVVNRTALTAICVGICVIEPMIRMWTTASGGDFYPLTWCRLDGLATGAALAIWFRSPHANRRNSLMLAGGMLLLLAVVTAVATPYGLNVPFSVVSTGLRGTQGNLIFGAFICTVYAIRGSALVAPLRVRFMTLTGEISYCLYLVHLSLADGYDLFAPRQAWFALMSPAGAVLVRGLVVGGLSYLIAMLSFRYFDGPILAQKERFTLRASS